MQSNESSTFTVRQRGKLDYVELIEQCCRPRRPAILTDAISHWPVVTRWTPSCFAERVGDRRVEIDGGSYTVAQMIGMLDASTPEAPAPYHRHAFISELHGDEGVVYPPDQYAVTHLRDSPTARRTSAGDARPSGFEPTIGGARR